MLKEKIKWTADSVTGEGLPSVLFFTLKSQEMTASRPPITKPNLAAGFRRKSGSGKFRHVFPGSSER